MTSAASALKISLSALAETKMALHTTKHGFSNPIHGIVVGRKSSNTDGDLMEIVDAIPVCHEVPTKPIVDMALRLCDAHLLQQQQEGNNQLTIIGWYTSNASTVDDETPNLSACRIASSMSDNGDEGDNNFILVLVTTVGIIAALAKDSDSESSPSYRVFQKATRTKTFSQEVDWSLISHENDVTREIIRKALTKGLPIYDYVDHISNYGVDDNWKDMDWITNAAITSLAKENPKSK